MNWTIEVFLKFARSATEEFQRQAGMWSSAAQMNHTSSEVRELKEALRKGEPTERIAEEIWDIVFSALTNAHVLEISDEELISAFNHVVNKLRERMKNNYYAKKVRTRQSNP